MQVKSLLPTTCALLWLTACGGRGQALPSASPAPASPKPSISTLLIPPSGSIYLGAFANPAHLHSPPISELASLETQIGRTFALSQHFYNFDDVFPGADEANDAAKGRVPIESWNCGFSNASIASGNKDVTIKARADAAKAYGKPLFIRYMWEMNLASSIGFRQACYDAKTDFPDGVFSQQEFIAAWRHIRGIFSQEGATNVLWLWNPSGANNPSAYYPGDAQVDWVGFDHYDNAKTSFLTTYQQAYAWLSPFQKPIIIGETGAQASIQPTYFEQAPSTLQANFPLVKGFIYFDAVGHVNDWTISGANIDAFKNMALNSYFSAMP